MPSPRALLFFLFLALLGGGFLIFLNANRNYQRPAPSSAVWSPSDKPIKIVTFNIHHSAQGNRAVFDQLARLNPDFILLQEVNKADLTALSEGYSSVPAIYHASENLGGKSTNWGSAILSKYPLYETGAIPTETGKSFGVWATAVIGDRKFKIASIHLAQSTEFRSELQQLLQSWRNANSPPIIIGGDFANSSVPSQFPFNDPLKSLGKDHNSRHKTLFISPDWKPLDAGPSQSTAQDDQPLWFTTGK